MSTEIIEFKQHGVSKEDIQSAGKVTIISAIFLAFALCGLPAFCATVVWTSLNMQAILHAAVTSAQIFKYCYVLSVGCALPPIAILAALGWTTRNMDKVSANLTVCEEGVSWKPASLATEWLLRLCGQQPEILPWSKIAVVGAGEYLIQARTQYGLIVDEAAYAKRGPRSGVLSLACAALGRSGHINFIVKAEDGIYRRRISFYPNALSAESRLQLLSAMQRWAPNVVITEQVVAELTGPTLEKRDVQFTDIWLEVMDASRERKRQSDLAPGDLLNHERYRILSKMATGGQANLYLAADTQLATCEDAASAEAPSVQARSQDSFSGAAKIVLKEFVLSSAGAEGALNCLAEFENESKIMQALTSSFFCRLEEIFVEDGRAYLVLEHIPARSLRQVVKENGKLSSPHVVAIARQLASAISYLHGLDPPVIHRDISPDNVLLNETDEIKLIDFSVSIRGESDIAGSAVGKPAYMSPDQFRGLAKRKNDIYSFGATIFFLLTGEEPEPISQSCPFSQSRHLSVAGEVDDALDNIVARCTALNSAAGYDSIEDVLQALNAIPRAKQLSAAG